MTSSVKDPNINYDLEGGLYPADMIELAVLLNSDWLYVFKKSICSKSPEVLLNLFTYVWKMYNSIKLSQFLALSKFDY